MEAGELRSIGRTTMKIAELQAHHDAFTESDRTIRMMVADGEFATVFSACVESFPHIVPAINFRKKKSIAREYRICLPSPQPGNTARHSLSTPRSSHFLNLSKPPRVLMQSEKNFIESAKAARNREILGA